jgi:predicted transcriptional regulator
VKRERIYDQAKRLEEMLEDFGGNISFEDLRGAISDIGKIYGSIIALDKQIQTKRKMLLDIEKENIMTIAAALRSIPKKPEDKTNPLKEALANDG